VDGLDGADAVVAGADQVGADLAVPAGGGQGVPVAGDLLVEFWVFECAFAGVVGPGHGEVVAPQPDLVGLVLPGGRRADLPMDVPVSHNACAVSGDGATVALVGEDGGVRV
jgi:hypothetical protein